MLGARLWERQKEEKRAQAEAAAKLAADQEAKIMSEFLKGQTGGIDVSILRAFLEGASWADSFDQFIIANCPQFATFVVGQEYGLQQSDVHLKFVATAEGLLDQQLGQMGASAEGFLEQVMSDMKTAPPGSPAAKAAAAVMQRLEECADFERFGVMMRQRYESIQAGEDQNKDDDDDDDDDDDGGGNGTNASAGSDDQAELMREQQQIKADRERRMHARKEAMERAAAAALELDEAEEASATASATPEPEPEPEPEPAAAGEIRWEDGSDIQPHRPFLAGWEIGTVHRGVVSFWEWGMAGVGGYGMILKMGRPEIYVHNTALPLDAHRRWLRRGEQVEFTVGQGEDGPMATKVVGVGADGTAPAPLLCQQMKGFKVLIGLDKEEGRFKLTIGQGDLENLYAEL